MRSRWALLGEIGDLLGPVLFAALAALALDWRAAYLGVGGLVLFWAMLLALQAFPAPEEAVPRRDPVGAPLEHPEPGGMDARTALDASAENDDERSRGFSPRSRSL